MPTTYEALERKCNDAAIKIRNVTDERDRALEIAGQHRATIDKLTKGLAALALRGTHHDTWPTRMLARTDGEQRIDAWWQEYFLSADKRVRLMAHDVLESIK